MVLAGCFKIFGSYANCAVRIPASFIAWLYFRASLTARIYYVILSMVVARIGMNLLYLPDLTQKTRAYAKHRHVDNLLAITDEQGFYLSGVHYTHETEISFGSLGPIVSAITTALILSYSIPYYYSSKMKQVLLYEPDMAHERYYLLNMEDIGLDMVDTLYTFQDSCTKYELALVQVK